MTIIVGAGPAGLKAATVIAGCGGEVTLLDSQPRLGGQYWRHSEVAATNQDFGHDGKRLKSLLDEISQSTRISVRTGVSVWHSEMKNQVPTLHLSNQDVLTSQTVLIATGAYDRTLPFPGWDLPGSMSAGGAQALLKGTGALLGRKVFVAGTGPFLLPVAAALVEAGVKVLAVLEASPINGWFKHFNAIDPSKIKDLFRYMKILQSARVPIKIGYAIVEARGDGRVQEVTISKVDKNFTIIPTTIEIHQCDAIATGWGFTPDLSLAYGFGVETVVSEIDHSVAVSVNERQESSVPGIFAAGETTGIGGVELALVEGEIAGLAIALRRGLISKEQARDRSLGLSNKRAKYQKFATALSEVYRIRPGWRSWLKPDTTICRCEEVNFDKVVSAVHDLGAEDVRSAKNFTRCGMGLCQGRICGLSVAEIVSAEVGRAPTNDELRGINNRPIISPIKLGELANSSFSE